MRSAIALALLLLPAMALAQQSAPASRTVTVTITLAADDLPVFDAVMSIAGQATPAAVLTPWANEGVQVHLRQYWNSVLAAERAPAAAALHARARSVVAQDRAAAEAFVQPSKVEARP
jgi:hypothetical protein